MEDKTLNQDLENSKVETGNAPDETPKKKKGGIKGFLQFILFVVLSMAGFIVQLVVKLLGPKIGFIQDLDADASKNFLLFGLSWLDRYVYCSYGWYFSMQTHQLHFAQKSII